MWTPAYSGGLYAQDVQSAEDRNLGTRAGRLENQPDVSFAFMDGLIHQIKCCLYGWIDLVALSIASMDGLIYQM